LIRDYNGSDTGCCTKLQSSQGNGKNMYSIVVVFEGVDSEIQFVTSPCRGRSPITGAADFP